MSTQPTPHPLAGLVPSLLLVLFVGLKLGEVGVVATWPWLWVLSPLWFPLALYLAVLLVAVLVALIVAAVQATKGGRR